MSICLPIPKETAATRAAFRAGVKGMRYTENPDPVLDIPVVTDRPPGPNERHFEATERLPGLSDPVAAYEAGRALRMIGHIMDAEGSPPSSTPTSIAFTLACRLGATSTRRSATGAARTPATRAAMDSARSMSTRPRGSGRYSALGFARIGASRRASCHYTWRVARGNFTPGRS